MELAVILLFILLCVSGIIYFLSKVIDWVTEKRKARYRDSTSELLSDIDRLVIKWRKRGEPEFAQALVEIQNALLVEEEPKTQYGKDLKKALNK